MKYLGMAGLMLAALGGCPKLDDMNDDIPGDGKTDFAAFVIDLIQNNTAENNEPIDLNTFDFTFSEDEAAFATLFNQN